ISSSSKPPRPQNLLVLKTFSSSNPPRPQRNLSSTTFPVLKLILLVYSSQPSSSTVKRVDEVVRHPHLVTQDQNTQVSNKVSDIHVENSIINIKLFRNFSQVIELVRYDYISHVELIVCKCRTSSTELEFFKSSMPRLGSNLQSSHPQSCTLPLRHTFFLV
ncbi:MAG: hypothetical protein ACK53Y_06925, partial [bacterium]